MTRPAVNIATLYSSAQCVLSVVGSVGVILLFAGIPQLIYSPTVSIANLMTFLLGAVLITTMVAGNSFLNYKYRKFTRSAQQNQHDANSNEATPNGVETDDKPPSYEAILSSDGLPPDYFSIISEKPPRYEDVTTHVFTPGTITPAVPSDGEVPLHTGNTTSSVVGITENSSSQGSSPKETTTETQTESNTSSSKAEKEPSPSTAEVTTTPTTTPTTTQLTIGYDNEAFTSQLEDPAPLSLRESES